MGKKLILIILSGLLLYCTGCKTSAEFNHIENSIRNEISPANLDTDFKFSIGWLSKRIACSFMDDEADVYLKEIKKVQVGIYKISNSDRSDSFRIPDNVKQCMLNKGWEPFVYVRDKGGENVSIYFRQLSEEVASIYVIALEPRELVIVEFSGKLNKILEKTICEHHLAGMERL